MHLPVRLVTVSADDRHRQASKNNNPINNSVKQVDHHAFCKNPYCFPPCNVGRPMCMSKQQSEEKGRCIMAVVPNQDPFVNTPGASTMSVLEEHQLPEITNDSGLKSMFE